MKKPINVRLPAEIADAVKKEALASGKSQARVMSDWLAVGRDAQAAGLGSIQELGLKLTSEIRGVRALAAAATWQGRVAAELSLIAVKQIKQLDSDSCEALYDKAKEIAEKRARRSKTSA